MKNNWLNITISCLASIPIRYLPTYIGMISTGMLQSVIRCTVLFCHNNIYF